MSKFLKFVSLVALSVVFSGPLTAAAKSEEVIAPTPAQAMTTIDILEKLSKRHYRDLAIDNEVSKRFLKDYLKSLDPAHLYFYQEDIRRFNETSQMHDDYLKKGNLEPGFEIFSVYRHRLEDRLQWVLDRLKDDKYEFKFDTGDSISIDREDAARPKDREEADLLWEKRLKLSLLNLKLAGKEVPEARETLIRRYKNQLNRVSQQNSQDVYETLINTFTMLYDPHTNYFSPRTSENFNINMSLQLEGIGAVLQSEEEHTKVVRLVAGGPADRQGGLKPADKIIGVGQGADGEIVDVIGWRLDEVVDLIRGKKDTTVKLEVLTGETAPKVLQIKRGTVKLEDQAAQKAVMEVSDGETMRKLGVINIPAFYHDFDAYRRGDQDFRSTSRDVARLLGELQKEEVEGIILDLRNNGGGSLQEATLLTDLFIDQGPVVQIRESTGRVSQHHRSRSRALYRGPLVVLVNRLSASASEIFAGAIQDYQRGLIIGSQSFGKGTVQLLSGLPEGQLKLTESKFYRVSGESTQHRGVIPDIPMPVLIDHEQVGESTYENALPWDKIPPAKHGVYFDFNDMLPVLKKQHQERSEHDPDIQLILDKIKLAEETKNKKTISLNEQTRIAEKDALELKQMAIENKHRKSKGLKVFETIKDYRDYEKVDEEKQEAAAAEPRQAIDLEGDAILNETGFIMLDLINMQANARPSQVANF